MAPIATQPEVSPDKEFEFLRIKRVVGEYKEQAGGAQAYNRKLEEEGDERNPKAHVQDAP